MFTKKKIISIVLTLVLCISSVTGVSAATKKYVKSLAVSKASVSITAGAKSTVKATVKGTASKAVKVKSNNTSVATVKAGKAKKGVTSITITGVKAGTATVTVTTAGKNKKKKAMKKTIKITVKGGTTGTKPSVSNPTNPSNPSTPSEPAFKAEDYSVKYETFHKMVSFKINTEVISAEELQEQGYTISPDGKNAEKDNVLLRATFQFDRLPSNIDELKKFDLSSEVMTVDGYTFDVGMCKPMAANILAIHSFKQTNRLDTSNPIAAMLDYVQGPNLTIANVNKQFINGQLMDYPELKTAYFNGATPTNQYEPTTPYRIVVEEGPYYIPAKTTITGNRPETHMVFVHSEGADTDRYIDVFKSADGNWYSWDSCYKNLLASVKTPSTSIVW